MLPQTIICIGRSGSGKGTQIQLLQAYLHSKNSQIQTIHIETGQYFRDFIQENTVSASLAKEVYITGKRQPDFLAISMWGYILCKDYTGKEHLMFDGAPRSFAEAHVVEDALSFYKRFDTNTCSKPKVIYLNVPREWSIERMNGRGRLDDKKEAEDVRSAWFETEVMGAIDFFRANKNFDFIEIKADKSIQDVHADIISHFV